MTTEGSNRGTYKKTHPWLTFHINLRSLDPTVWIALGECASKSEHIASVPLRPGTAQKLNQMYLAKGILGTTAIEGNTLSEADVLLHLDGKLDLPPSRAYLKQEIDNILTECNDIVGRAARGERQPTLTSARIQWLNAQSLEKLDVDEDVVPGQFRLHSVGVARYRGASHEECAMLTQELCDWLSGPTFRAPPEQRRVYAIIKAIIAHLYLAWIHPFGDGNGRTARLIEFQILFESGIPSPAAHLLSNHYNQTRAEYYRQLDRSSRSGPTGDIIPFLTYAIQGFLDGLRSQLDVINNQQLDVVWENFVHDMFRYQTSTAQQRRKHLLLDISRYTEPVSVAGIPEISPRMAQAYANKTKRTIIRDLNALAQDELIKKQGGGYLARTEILRYFLPVAAPDD